jgi:hypothetical protein
VLYKIAAAGFGGWFLCRLAVRERYYRAAVAAGRLTSYDDDRTLLVHGADALAFALFVSPSVWTHHYVLAIPLALAAWSVRLPDRSPRLVVALGLIFLLPTFDVFPVSFVRFASLVMIWLETPARRRLLASVPA